MAELQFYLLGHFQACWDFVPFREALWRVPGSRPLLQILFGHRKRALTVEDACRLTRLTPEGVEEAIIHLNRILERGAAIVREGDAVRIEPASQCWIDADAFRAHYRAGVSGAARGEMLPAIMAFQEADALYQGDYLEEMQGEWLDGDRLELQRLYAEILDRLAEGHAVLARYLDAIGFCHKALVRDPLREATYQRMMVYYYYLGALEEAEEAYRQCHNVLAEAGRRPGPETETLWVQLQHRTLPAGLQQVAASRENPGRSGRKSLNDS